MGKKKLRKAKTSKGQRRSIGKLGVKLAAAGKSAVDIATNKVNAWRAGKNPWVTIQNKDSGTNRPFYKVKANEIWGNPKFLSSGLFKGKEE